MGPRNQRGQALPAVLAIMLLLVLLAGGASMAISAVLRQQSANRSSTNADLSSQNAVAAAAANIAGRGSACAPASASAPDTLFQDDFQSPIGQRWSFPSGDWVVQPDDPVHGQVLADNGAGPGADVATLNPAIYQNAARWSYYSVSVDLRPRSAAQGTWTELDAYYQTSGQAFSGYWLRLQDGNSWTFGRTGPTRTFARSGFTYDTGHWQTLELDVFGAEITARINGIPVARHQDGAPIASGGIAVRASGSQAEADNVSVDQPIPAPTLVPLSLPNLPSPGLPQQFYCQRLGGINTGAVSQQRIAASTTSSCSAVGASLMVPGRGDHLKIWFTVPWPAGVAASHVAVGLGGCPSDPASADCGRQRSTIVPGTDPAWRPGLTVVGADCTNLDARQGPTRYPVFLATTYRGGLPPMGIRSARAGDGAVYMTTIAVRAASGEPYEESDFLLPQGGSAFLSYEGVLG